MRALYWKEIRSFLGSMIGYVFIIIFLVVSGIFHWIVLGETNLLYGPEADMIPFFNLSPLIFLILIPAITMRMIAEERKNGTIELLFTRPISDLKIILAKFFASVSLLVISLLPTFIFFWSMQSLGITNSENQTAIDEGATFTSYIGLILLGAVFAAIGMFASSITTNQIIAFVIAMFLCWFLYDGFELIGSFNLMGDKDYILQYIGLNSHYKSIMRGVIDTSDIIYFFGMIFLFITASLITIKSLKR